MKKEKIIIVGAGPAGISCAIQLKRQGLNPLVIERNTPGGLIRNAHRIDNYPGFPKGINGEKFCGLMLRHIKQYKIRIINDEALKIEHKNNLFNIKGIVDDYRSSILVLAIGTEPKKSDIPIINESAVKKIFTEIHPIRNVRKKTIAVVGGGDAAFDYALSLSNFNTVTIINRNRISKCIQSLYDEVFNIKKIHYLNEAPINCIIDEGSSLKIECRNGNNKVYLNCDYLVIAIGREVNHVLMSPTFKKKIDKLNEQKKLFFIGDVKNKDFRQLSISVADGIRAAMEISS